MKLKSIRSIIINSELYLNLEQYNIAINLEELAHRKIEGKIYHGRIEPLLIEIGIMVRNEIDDKD